MLVLIGWAVRFHYYRWFDKILMIIWHVVAGPVILGCVGMLGFLNDNFRLIVLVAGLITRLVPAIVVPDIVAVAIIVVVAIAMTITLRWIVGLKKNTFD